MAIEQRNAKGRLQLRYENSSLNRSYSGVKPTLTNASAAPFVSAVGALQNTAPDHALLIVETELYDAEP